MNSMTSNSIDNEMPKNSDSVPPKAEIKASEYHWKYIEKEKFNDLHIQLNKYETEPYFLQFFQSNATVCLIIHVFC